MKDAIIESQRQEIEHLKAELLKRREDISSILSNLEAMRKERDALSKQIELNNIVLDVAIAKIKAMTGE